MVYGIAWILARILFYIFIRCEVKGKENIPRRGAVIVVANHLNNLDAPLLGFCLGRRAAYFGKEELFSSAVLAFVMKQLGAFPVRRGRLNLDALRKTYEILADGRAMVVFPEGTRSEHARLKLAYDGTALIAVRSQALLLPIGVAGTEVIKGVGWIWHRPRISVNIGATFRLPKIDGKIAKEQLSEYTETIMKRIAGLLPSEYRGIYTQAGKQDDTGD